MISWLNYYFLPCVFYFNYRYFAAWALRFVQGGHSALHFRWQQNSWWKTEGLCIHGDSQHLYLTVMALGPTQTNTFLLCLSLAFLTSIFFLQDAAKCEMGCQHKIKTLYRAWASHFVMFRTIWNKTEKCQKFEMRRNLSQMLIPVRKSALFSPLCLYEGQSTVKCYEPI